jgi:hypothetical protein
MGRPSHLQAKRETKEKENGRETVTTGNGGADHTGQGRTVLYGHQR